MHQRVFLGVVALTVAWPAAMRAQAKAATPVSNPVMAPSASQPRAPEPLPASSSASAAVLPTRNYKLFIQFTEVNGATETHYAVVTVHVTHSGPTLTLGTQQADLSGGVSATHMSVTGSRTISDFGNLTLTLDGTPTPDGATGTVTLTGSGQHAAGTFSLVPYPMIGAMTCGNPPFDTCEKVLFAALDILTY